MNYVIPFLNRNRNSRNQYTFVFLQSYLYLALSILKSEILMSIQLDGGWWRGNCRGRRGVFPSNYVQEIPKQAQAAAAPIQQRALPSLPQGSHEVLTY